MKTEIIAFSKNRTLQLKSLLLSLRHFSDIDEKRINIIYVESDGITYDKLKEQFRCNFIKQGIFLEDIRKIVDNTNADYIMFMVDDLIFRSPFSIKREEDFLDKRLDIDAFSHRLGLNIKIGKEPEFEEKDSDMLVWDCSAEYGKHWNYFWEVSSSTYRKPLVKKYLSRCRVQKEFFPNPFEFHYYSSMLSTRASWLVKIINNIRFPFMKVPKRMASYRKSICFTQGINLVAEIDDDRKEIFDIKSLHKKMEESYVADFLSLENADIRAPNAGHEYFKLIKEEELKQNA